MPTRDVAANRTHQAILTFDGTGLVGTVVGERRSLSTVRFVNSSPDSIRITVEDLTGGRTVSRTFAAGADVTFNLTGQWRQYWAVGPSGHWDGIGIMIQIPAPPG